MSSSEAGGTFFSNDGWKTLSTELYWRLLSWRLCNTCSTTIGLSINRPILYSMVRSRSQILRSFKLQYQFGFLDQWFPTNQLLGVLESDHQYAGYKIQNITVSITLHTAVSKRSTGDRVAIACNCKNKCQERGRCLKNLVKCLIYCHTDCRDCGNLSSLHIGTGSL